MSPRSKKDMYRPPDDALWLLPLGGSGEIGMNLNLYGTKGKWLMVDCGIMFGDETTPGIEIIMPDISFIEERKEDLVGIVITHAHEDHFGAIEHLWARLRCPVYAPPFAASLLRSKLTQAGMKGLVPLKEIPNGGSFNAEPFSVELVRVTHSVPDTHMLAIKTDHGTVIHTGDWRLDDTPVVGPLADEDRFKELGRDGIMAVVGDSTGAMEMEPAPSEMDVQAGLIDLFGAYKKRIAVTCFSTNTGRLKSIAIAARKNGRYVSLVGRSLWRNAEIAHELGYLPEYDQFLSEHEAMLAPRDKVVMVCTGCQGEKRAALSRIAVFDHPVVSLDRGDVVVFSARVIPGNEKPIARMQNLLVAQGVRVIDSDSVRGQQVIHASGHAGQPELKRFYDWVRPGLIIPVHGEPRHQEEHVRFAQTLGYQDFMVPQNGQIMRLGPGVYEKLSEVPVGTWCLDGGTLKPLDQAVVKNRRKMSFNGAAVVSIVLDRKGLLVSDPQIALMGVDDDDSMRPLRAALVEELTDQLERLPRSTLLDDGLVKQTVLRILRRQLREKKGKKPMVDVHLTRV